MPKFKTYNSGFRNILSLFFKTGVLMPPGAFLKRLNRFLQARITHAAKRHELLNHFDFYVSFWNFSPCSFNTFNSRLQIQQR